LLFEYKSNITNIIIKKKEKMITLKYSIDEIEKIIDALESVKHQAYHAQFDYYMKKDFDIFIDLLDDIKLEALKL